jgi:hypothetical protein
MAIVDNGITLILAADILYDISGLSLSIPRTDWQLFYRRIRSSCEVALIESSMLPSIVLDAQILKAKV